MDAHTSTVLTLVLWMLMGMACAYFAYQRGRDPYAWFAIGIFLGIFGLLLLILLPPVVASEEAKQEESKNQLLEVIDPEEKEEEVSSPPVSSHEYLIQTWFCIDKNSQQVGPVPYSSLEALWKDQKIDDHSFVWSEGMPEWKKIEEIPNLYLALKSDEV